MKDKEFDFNRLIIIEDSRKCCIGYKGIIDKETLSNDDIAMLVKDIYSIVSDENSHRNDILTYLYLNRKSLYEFMEEAYCRPLIHPPYNDKTLNSWKSQIKNRWDEAFTKIGILPEYYKDHLDNRHIIYENTNNNLDLWKKILSKTRPNKEFFRFIDSHDMIGDYRIEVSVESFPKIISLFGAIKMLPDQIPVEIMFMTNMSNMDEKLKS